MPRKAGPPRLRHKSWRNRIVGTEDVAPDQLLASPDNYRIHSHEQEAALAAVLDRVGWVQRVLVNRRTNHVIDGHLRVALAITREEKTVPVTYVDVDEAEESLLLACIDPLSALAGTDKGKYDELVGLLPDDLSEIAKLAWGDEPTATEVSFTATAHHRVVVECADEASAYKLVERLTEEGYQCRLKG